MLRAKGAANVRQYQGLLALAGGVYLCWWFVVEWMLPGSFNPLLSRLLVCASFFVVLALTFASDFFRARIRTLYWLLVCVMTAQYFYLFHHNSRDPNWVVGSYITVVALGVTLETVLALIGFSAIVLAMAFYIQTVDPVSVVSLPGTLTVLLLINVVGFLRRRADEERRLRSVLEADKHATETVNRVKMLFLANVNHELRTPLAGIVGFSDLLLAAPELRADSRSFVERIQANAGILTRTVEQLLALTESGVSAAPATIRNEALDLRQMLARRVESERPTADAKGLSLTLKFHDNVPKTVQSDGDVLQFLFGNVLENAVKFTPKGGVEVEASVAAEAAPGTVGLIITIRDTGLGLAPADWERIFEPFTQIQSTYNRPFGGSGIGLTLARKLARVLQGDVVVTTSKLGGGSTFTITLVANRD